MFPKLDNNQCLKYIWKPYKEINVTTTKKDEIFHY